jgi:hypothetical protein
VSPYRRRYICDAVVGHGDIGQQSLRDQWKQLIFRSFSMLENGQVLSTPLIFVIDVLDECERENDIRIILQSVAEAKNFDTIQLRLFIISRSEISIRFDFRALPENVCQNFVLHNISPFIVEHDISIVIRDEQKKIKKKRHICSRMIWRTNR